MPLLILVGNTGVRNITSMASVRLIPKSHSAYDHRFTASYSIALISKPHRIQVYIRLQHLATIQHTVKYTSPL